MFSFNVFFNIAKRLIEDRGETENLFVAHEYGFLVQRIIM
jgi:hypothetical protein